jgi:hypothetical protein
VLSSRPDGPPDPVATGDMPWGRGYRSCHGENVHIEKVTIAGEIDTSKMISSFSFIRGISYF